MILVTIRPGHQLAPAPAASYARMRAEGMPGAITSSTRDPDLQAAYYAHQGDPGWPALAENPAKSKHVAHPGAADEGARALDLPPAEEAWVRAWGGPHGWHFPIPSERWHAEYVAAWDLHRNSPSAAQPAPPPAPPVDPWEEDTMRELIEDLYRVGLDREGEPGEVATWHVTAVENEWTPAEVRAEFWRSTASAGTVQRAFRDFLGHDATVGQVADWTGPGKTIAAVRAGVFGSEEAMRRRGVIV